MSDKATKAGIRDAVNDLYDTSTAPVSEGVGVPGTVFCGHYIDVPDEDHGIHQGPGAFLVGLPAEARQLLELQYGHMEGPINIEQARHAGVFVNLDHEMGS